MVEKLDLDANNQGKNVDGENLGGSVRESVRDDQPEMSRIEEIVQKHLREFRDEKRGLLSQTE